MTDTLFATSADGTRIAYETRGAGPALVFVDGALCHAGQRRGDTAVQTAPVGERTGAHDVADQCCAWR